MTISIPNLINSILGAGKNQESFPSPYVDPSVNTFTQGIKPLSGMRVIGESTPTPTPTSIPNPTSDDPFKGFKQKIPDEYKPLILEYSQRKGIDPRIIASVLFQESGIQPIGKEKDNLNYDKAGKLVGRDRGIAQINSSAFPNVTDEQAYDPTFAIKFAIDTLTKNKKYLNDDLSQAIASYNVGLGGVKNNLGQDTPFGGGPKGQTYIDNVVRNLDPELIKSLGIKTNIK